ncbi:hypothetical protein ACVRZS_06305 [Streptococcus ferus]|uniref:Uncharacterized protein n=1 Tax=Streptococcus ferus TaxID=1345 RepID=A0A2X3VTU1_9STRE|nr:hypothetical protein [Streptococcus ferus]SQF41155.1 Uncharacterised protein [Streptococcus ferus]
MKDSKNSSLIKLQSVFLTISLLGTLAIILAESRLLVSLIIMVVIIILAFTNMLWLRQLDNKVNNR